MRHAMLVCTVLAVVSAVWLSACSASPAAVAPPQEATGSPTMGHEDDGLESTPASLTRTPPASPATEAQPNSSVGTPATEEESVTTQPTPATPGTKQPSDARQIVEIAKEDLARRLGLSPGEISVTSVEAVAWPDASLGCPQQGMMYAQVITPGFLIVLEAGGQTYEYHSDEGGFVVLCRQQGATPAPLIPIDPDEIDDGEPWVPVH